LKIALFISEWPLSLLPWVCTIVEGLVHRGFEVHLFVRNSDKVSGLFDVPVRVIDLNRLDIDVANWFELNGHLFPYSDVIDKESLMAVHVSGCSQKYDWCIGFERIGLLLAKTASHGAKCPLAYLNFELYELSYPGIYGDKLSAILRHETAALNTVDLFIIQDDVREAHYQRIIGSDVQPKETFHLPVSLNSATEQCGNEWHRRYKLPHDTHIILYTGTIGENRFIDQFITAAQTFPDNYQLIIHGPAFGRVDYLAHLRKLDRNNRVILSTKMAGWKERSKLVASADVGIVYYRQEPANDRETARSSDKVAAYLAAGIPFVCPAYPGYIEIANRYHCASCVDGPLRIGNAIKVILENYSFYREGAHKAFSDVYNAAGNLDRLVETLQRIAAWNQKTISAPPVNTRPLKEADFRVHSPTDNIENGIFENAAFKALGYSSFCNHNEMIAVKASLFPQIKRISFQLSNLCNYSPVHKKCPLHQEVSRHILPSSLVLNTLDEISEINYSGIIAFHIYNEPLIDPRLFSFIDETRNRCPNAKIYILTNGYYLNQVMIEELTQRGIWLLWASAYSKEEFSRLSNYRTAIPYKVVSSTLDERKKLYGRDILDKKAQCFPFINDVSVACTGEIILCCLDWERRYVFGNLRHQKLRDIIDSNAVRKVAESLMIGERHLGICRRCDWIR
jgi:GTP 3',8-cyclase